MLKNILDLNGVEKLNSSAQKAITGSGSCASNIYCNTDADCPDGPATPCIAHRCHLF